MTVRIVMHASSLPDGYPADDRDQNYEDTSGARYTYTLHPSGALTVFKKEAGMPIADVEVIYGPTAWESVQGDGGNS